MLSSFSAITGLGLCWTVLAGGAAISTVVTLRFGGRAGQVKSCILWERDWSSEESEREASLGDRGSGLDPCEIDCLCMVLKEDSAASEKVKRSKRAVGLGSGLGLLREISRTPGRLRGVELEGLGGRSEELLLEWDI